jgi:hypothetical protein
MPITPRSEEIEGNCTTPTVAIRFQFARSTIVGFEQQRLRIDTQIAELRSIFDGGPTKPAPAAMPEAPTLKRRKFSAAARRRMKEAQQLRWAKIRGESESPAPASEAPKPKRKLSKQGRANIVAALKKRWAEKKTAAAKPVRAAKKTAAKKAPAKAAKKAAAKKTDPTAVEAGA